MYYYIMKLRQLNSIEWIMVLGPALLVFHKNKAFDCHLKLNKINFVLLEQYTNKQTNQKYKCAEKILSERVKVSSICTVHMYE